jgi:hypothetical protein
VIGVSDAIRQFLLDLLRERNAVDFHRFQMMTGTVILGVIFIFGVFQQLAMPKFDATLLALMGISSGTYLGFKWARRKGRDLTRKRPQLRLKDCDR